MTNQTQDGGPAFSRPASEYEPNEMRADGRIAALLYNGMSLRDYFAAAALATMTGLPYEAMGLRAYLIADLMLKARATTEKE